MINPEDLASGNVDTTPTIPITDIERVRFSELNAQLTNALRQGYVEANVLNKLLDLAKMLVPLIPRI